MISFKFIEKVTCLMRFNTTLRRMDLLVNDTTVDDVREFIDVYGSFDD